MTYYISAHLNTTGTSTIFQLLSCTFGGQGHTESEFATSCCSSMTEIYLVLIHPALWKLSLMSQMWILPILGSRPCMQARARSLFSSKNLFLSSLVGLYPRPYLFLFSTISNGNNDPCPLLLNPFSYIYPSFNKDLAVIKDALDSL